MNELSIIFASKIDICVTCGVLIQLKGGWHLSLHVIYTKDWIPDD